MKVKFICLSLVMASTSAGASDLYACRASYGKAFASARRSDVRRRFVRDLAGSGFVGWTGTAAADFIRYKFLARPSSVMSNPTKATVVSFVGASLFAVALLNHSGHLESYDRHEFDEALAHAIDESYSGRQGPASIVFVKFIEAALKTSSRAGKAVSASGLNASRDLVASLKSTFARTTPTAAHVQDAIRYLGDLGLLCYADDSALSAGDFSNRFAYALEQVVASQAK